MVWRVSKAKFAVVGADMCAIFGPVLEAARSVRFA